MNTIKWMNNLETIIKGTGIVFIGNMIALTINFLSRIAIARSYTPEEYGIFSISLVLLTFLTILSTLGIHEGVARQIAYHLGKAKKEKIGKLIVNSITICFITGIILFAIAYLLLTIFISNNNRYIIFKTLVWSLPFFVLIYIIAGIFRGFGLVKEKVFFMDITRNGFFFLIVLYVTSKKLPFNLMILGLSISIIITSVLFTARLYRYIRSDPVLRRNLLIDINLSKQLLKFSLPLLLTGILYYILNWNSILLLGYMGTSKMVGVYNASFNLSLLLSMILSSLLFAYLPVLSRLIAVSAIDELKMSYKTISKWLYIFSLPIGFIFLIFPEYIINFIYGNQYVNGGMALRFLIIGFMANIIMGPSEAVVIAIGETKYLARITLFAVIINIAVGFLLIPEYGVNGCAMATMIAITILSLMRFWKIYKLFNIKLFNYEFLKLFIILYIVLIGIKILQTKTFINPFETFVLLTIFIIFMYFPVLTYLKIIDRTDIQFLKFIFKKYTKLERLIFLKTKK